VSLTIASLDGAPLDRATVGIAIIPHTYQHTAMQAYGPGTRINVEVDLIGKYIEKLMQPR
jgi:riboflavin synthase